MQRTDGELVLSPTDLTKHLGCAHITTLDLLASEGGPRPAATDDALQLIFDLGIAHEEAYLAYLRDTKSVVEIGRAFDAESRRLRETETVEAMRSGVDVVYQATFFDGSWGGQADFLVRVDKPSDLGDWSYEIQDTKLSRKLKVPALLQMATYAERLTTLQGVAPDALYVVVGDGDLKPWRLVDVSAFARVARARLRAAVEERPVTEPVPVAQCGQCRWIDVCDAEWRRKDDLSRVAFMRGDHRQALIDHGITTLTQLGRAALTDLPATIGRPSRERLAHQAQLQLAEKETGVPSYELLPVQEKQGLLRLPRPDDGDVYLDFEGDPYADDGNGREYLAGLGFTNGDFEPQWAHSRAEEKKLTIDLVDRLLAQWKAHPGMHVYHYAPYETSALKKLVSRHGVREEELDQLLRGERFVDLYAVVRQGLRISKPSYSIKKMEAFYWGHIRNQNPDVADAMSSVLAYERWMVEREQKVLDDILSYNHDDVRSTRDLHVWLEGRRVELEQQHGEQLRPEDVGDAEAAISDAVLAELALAEELTNAGEGTLAALVQWHRREAKPAWWDVFRLKDLDIEELIEDSTAIGGVSSPTDVGSVARSTLWRYDYPPQDCKLEVGKKVQCAMTQDTLGELQELDPEAGFLVVKKGKNHPPVEADGCGPEGPIATGVLSDSIHDAARKVLAGEMPLAKRLLLRQVPTGTAVGEGETPRAAVLRCGLTLDGDVLAVQGPPGSGKTTVGAELVRALLDRGLKVGVTANSHAVIGNLLKAINRPALQRCDPDNHCGHAQVTISPSNAAAAAALADGSAQLVGGTAWNWSSVALRDAVDVLVIDEAGQFSLANAVAVSSAARSLVLLGDPQQLAQPTRALHPDGAGCSALEYLLDGEATVPPDRGVFLGTTWRMHPDITSYVSDLAYDGRLQAGPTQELQAVQADGLPSHGIAVVDVDSTGCSAASPAEVAEVARLWGQLVAGTFTDRKGEIRPMTADDVLIVAPYNNQVGLLRQALPGARIGTVDKFQGQEAPVVIYSMTSSSAEDAPRGVGFLYDINRLNVAVSRAQALTVVVMSPRLIDANVHNPEQLRQVNALCRLVEHAEGYERAFGISTFAS